jgi:hypothetical protein
MQKKTKKNASIALLVSRQSYPSPGTKGFGGVMGAGPRGTSFTRLGANKQLEIPIVTVMT